jgi:hypothetical protein
MAEGSLNDIMNQMAEGLDPSAFSVFESERDQVNELTEFDAFLGLDETLKTLNKEYLDAKSQHDYLIKTFGPDDPMAEIAEDVMDSTWCAMQARYLEMREKRSVMEKAQYIMRESQKALEEAREKKKLEKSIEQGERLLAVARTIEQMREMNKDKTDYLLAAVVLLFGLLRFNNSFFHFKSVFNQHLHAIAA